MIKRNNKGFTLLELLISIFILTTVIFIGYRVINKSTIDIKNQSNINKGQLTMNDMNEYLTKDLEQASSIALFLNNEKVADTLVEENGDSEEKQNILSDKISDLENELNKLSIGNKFDYSYAIRFKNDENNTYSIKYKVEITKSNHDYKYSILMEENNGIKISFINDAVLKEKELPFLIEGNSPYKVTLGYTSKDNSFTKHEFTITYRLNNIITTNTTNPPETEVVPPQREGDVILDFRQVIDNGSVKWYRDYEIYNDFVKEEGSYANQPGNISIVIDRNNGSIGGHHSGGLGMNSHSNEKIKKISGFKIELVGGIELVNPTIRHNLANKESIIFNDGVYENLNLLSPNETQNIYIEAESFRTTQDFNGKASIVINFYYNE